MSDIKRLAGSEGISIQSAPYLPWADRPADTAVLRNLSATSPCDILFSSVIFQNVKNCLHTQSHKEISVGLIKGAHKPQVLAMPNDQESGRVGVARVGRLSHRCHPDRKVLGGRVQNNGTITRDYKHVLSTKWMLAWEDTCADKTASFIIFTNQYDSPVPT